MDRDDHSRQAHEQDAEVWDHLAGREVLTAVEGGGESERYPVPGISEQEGLPMVRSSRREWSDE